MYGLELDTISLDLSNLGVIRIQGDDSSKLLQGQATCNVENLTEHKGLLGSLCNIKGRMYASFYLLKEPESDQSLLMVMPRDNIASTLEKLAKYSLFFKVTLSDASQDFIITGDIINPSGPNHDSIVESPFAIESKDGRLTFTLPSLMADEPEARKIILTKKAENNQGVESTSSTNQPESRDSELAPQESNDLWLASDIINGTLLVQADMVESYIPLELSYDHPILEGVHFNKGCYTGQEIVARLHYRGNAKYQLIALKSQTHLDNPAQKVASLDKSLLVVNDAEAPEKRGESNKAGNLVAIRLFNEQLYACALVHKKWLEREASFFIQLPENETKDDQQEVVNIPMNVVTWSTQAN